MADTLEAAHKRSSLHRDEILASKVCGCFYCKKLFSSAEVVEWYNPKGAPNGETAACPYCGIDAVIGDASGYDLTPEFLAAMKQRWFKTTRKVPLKWLR